MSKSTAILCVDDESMVLSVLKRQLRRHFGNDYAIEVAQDGSEALEVVEECIEQGMDLALVISDYIMPMMRGDELLAKIHEIIPHTITILLTGQANTEGITNAVNYANLYRYIPKPWEQTDFVLTITEALRSYEQRRQLAEHNEALRQANQQLEHMNETLEIEVAARTAELKEAYDNLKLLNNRMEEDLALAREIQRGLLPDTHIQWGLLDVACYTMAAYEVGGDFYRYYECGLGHFAMLVGDVSGKGVAAALLMVVCLTQLDAAFAQQFSPADRLVWLDTAISHYTSTRHQNCALSYAEFAHSKSGNLTVTLLNAGCISPYVRRQEGELDTLEIGGFALGQKHGEKNGYEQETLTLSFGDMVILVSDGVVEAKNSEGEMFSFERLEQLLAQAPSARSAYMVAYLVREVTNFMGNMEPADDLTIVIARVGNA